MRSTRRASPLRAPDLLPEEPSRLWVMTLELALRDRAAQGLTKSVHQPTRLNMRLQRIACGQRQNAQAVSPSSSEK